MVYLSVKNYDNFHAEDLWKLVQSCKQLCLLCPPAPWNLPSTTLLSGFRSSQGAEMTIKLKSNLYVGPVNSFPDIWHCYLQFDGLLQKRQTPFLTYLSYLSFALSRQIAVLNAMMCQNYIAYSKAMIK